MEKRVKAIAVLIVVMAAAEAYLMLRSHAGSRQPTAASIPQHAGRNSLIIGVDGGNYFNSSTAASLSSLYRFKWIRVDLSFSPSFKPYFSALKMNNYNILGILDYETIGVQGLGPNCVSNCNWTLGQWNATVLQAVNTYPSIHAWEIWNEPQVPAFQSGFSNGSAYNYFLMARSAYGIIKAHNSTDLVICMGGDNIYTQGTGPDPFDYQWAQRLWGYGAARYCDAVSLHAYAGIGHLLSETPQGGNKTIGAIFNQSLDLYEALTGKPIWITEVGIPSNNFTVYGTFINNSPAKQALFLNQSFALFSSKPYVNAVFWFQIYGTVMSPYNLDYGLLNKQLQPKPSFYAFNSFLNKCGAC